MKKLGFAVLPVLGLILIQPISVSATGFDLQDASNFILLYEGASSAQLSINNFGTTGIWTGNIGVAGTGKLAATGPGTLNGNILFAAANTGQAAISNTTINGTVTYGQSIVQSAMNEMNTLSSGLGAVAGSGASLVIDTHNAINQTQTVLATAGNLVNGNLLFNVTSVTTNNGEKLIIKGDGSQNVVLDVNTPSAANFHGDVLLQDLTGKFYGDAGYNGLTPDQLLINLWGGSGLVGGDTLSGNDNGNNAHPSNIMYGVYLDPNGAISFVNTRIVGRIFGGDSVNMQIVSGDTISAPTAAPEPNSLVSLAVALLGLAGFIRRYGVRS